MKDTLLQRAKEFLKSKSISGPLLLGFSGGTDSLALLHLLLACKKLITFDLEVAHVDHGWREESGMEAEKLQQDIEALGLQFHLSRLEGGCQGEDKARQGRLAFFSSLYKKLGASALLLAHHGDDQSETVLKRIFEGASLYSLGGIKQETYLKGMRIWRPLLGVPKKELKAYLDKRGLKPLHDPTSFDLRTKMRAQIFPQLEKQFGKEIGLNLRKLGEAAEELAGYLDKKIEPYFKAVHHHSVDLSPFYPFEKVELKAFLKKWTAAEKVFLSRDALETLCQILDKGEGLRKIISRGKTLEIRNRAVAIYTSNFTSQMPACEITCV